MMISENKNATTIIAMVTSRLCGRPAFLRFHKYKKLKIASGRPNYVEYLRDDLPFDGVETEDRDRQGQEADHAADDLEAGGVRV